jgi:hypothetical protein
VASAVQAPLEQGAWRTGDLTIKNTPKPKTTYVNAHVSGKVRIVGTIKGHRAARNRNIARRRRRHAASNLSLFFLFGINAHDQTHLENCLTRDELELGKVSWRPDRGSRESHRGCQESTPGHRIWRLTARKWVGAATWWQAVARTTMSRGGGLKAISGQYPQRPVPPQAMPSSTGRSRLGRPKPERGGGPNRSGRGRA